MRSAARLIASILFALSLQACEPTLVLEEQPAQRTPPGGDQALEVDLFPDTQVTVARLAQATLTELPNRPHFRLLRIELASGSSIVHPAGPALSFQVTGSQRITTDNRERHLNPGEAVFLPAGRVMSSAEDEDAVFLLFGLVTPDELARNPAAPGAVVQELYRTAAPLDLQGTGHRFSLTHLALPPGTPPSAPHYRTGAGLTLVVSGTLDVLVDNARLLKPSSSVVLQPRGAVQRWANPDRRPVILLIADISRKGLAPLRIVDAAQ